MTPLMFVDELMALVAAGAPPALLDVRWQLGAPDPLGAYLAGHLPGAVYVDLESELAGPPDPAAGRHPLPDPDVFVARVAGWGISDDDAVVVYDDNGGVSAARLWWLLRWIGHGRVHVLDGGLGAWRSVGGAVETGPVEHAARKADASRRRDAMPTVSVVEVAAGTVGLLLDARAAERYRGDVEPIDPVGGHIPGARCAPTADNLRPDGRFADPADLRRRFSALGLGPGDPVAVYCGSGVAATHEILALELAGFPDAALYAPSWSGWVSDRRRPVARG